MKNNEKWIMKVKKKSMTDLLKTFYGEIWKNKL